MSGEKIKTEKETRMSLQEIFAHWFPVCAFGATLFGIMAWRATHSALWALLGVAGGAAIVLIIIAIAGSENENFRKE